jgi:diguanylate cyclase (GGDEF)-like protein/PAS domain S-box-containing protein
VRDAPRTSWTTVAADYAARGAVDDALVRAATEAGIGLVTVGSDGAVSWTDETYRLHGRPRWRRVRTIDDVLRGLDAADSARVQSAYRVSTTDPDVDARYVVRPDAGPDRELVLTAIDLGVAVVFRAGSESSVGPATATATVSATDTPDPAHEDLVVDVREPADPGVEGPSRLVPFSAHEPGVPAPEPDIASAVLSASPDLVVIFDVLANRIVNVAGSDPDAAELLARIRAGASGEAVIFGREVVHPDDIPRMAEWRRSLAALESDEVHHVDLRFALREGWRWRELRASEFVRDENDHVREVVVLVRDVHERVEAGLRLAQQERAFREVFDASPVGLAVLDDHGRFSAVNDAFCRLVGRTREEVLSTVYEALLHPEDRAAAVISRARRITEGGLSTATERRLLRSDGTVIWVRVRTSDIDYEDQPRTLVSAEDVTSAKATEDRLRYDALHDQLTGLPNRRLIVDRLDRALARSRRMHARLAVLFIDLDDLKRVNDTHPWQHRAGDALIIGVAQGIRATLRDADTLGRLGGDEFVAICEDVGDDETITEIGNRILSTVRQPMTIGGETVRVAASVGVAVPDDDEETAEQLLGRADSAMYRAKSGGGSRMVLADSQAEPPAAHVDLAAALNADELRLHYQPVVSLRTGAVLGVEAVMRWRHPERGQLSTGEIRAALDAGDAVLPVVAWSLQRAVADVRTVAPSRASHMSVWVSLPVRAALATATRAAIDAAFAGPDGNEPIDTAPSIVLGLRERDVSSLAGRHSFQRHLAELIEVGPVGLGVERFTADNAPIGLLRRLDTTSLKVETELFLSALEDPGVEELLAGLIATAGAMGIVTVATDIESPEHLSLARRVGVDAVQGDLIGPPAPLETYADLLHTGLTTLPDAPRDFLTGEVLRDDRSSAHPTPSSSTLRIVPDPTDETDDDPRRDAAAPSPRPTRWPASSPATSPPAGPPEPMPHDSDVPESRHAHRPFNDGEDREARRPASPAQDGSGGPADQTRPAQAALPTTDHHRLLLGGDIGEALARELGVELPAPAPAPLPPSPAVVLRPQTAEPGNDSA